MQQCIDGFSFFCYLIGQLSYSIIFITIKKDLYELEIKLRESSTPIFIRVEN